MKFSILILMMMISFGLHAQTKKIDTAKSSIHWVGKKITGKHDGTINFKEGSLVFDKNKLKGGSFTVDMTTINATDVSGGAKEKLDAHLKADDFFGVEKYPTSTLKITNITDKGNGVYTVTADLTIKAKSNPVTFDMNVSGKSASAKLSVDRTKYDITYKSGSVFDGLGDKAISDEFDLEVKLVF
ncbi:YceI family protein [Moheibacter lacus]|uniref:YceI family protein n=1 Tax=Moheibacter lacus TaxID=2745851 RepID=A0A838ZRT5_9FLAO|nr:YceI family protein [Moheibacter lacus]MBA5629303.1 YceI family protein [Moheibacter lacus]